VFRRSARNTHFNLPVVGTTTLPVAEWEPVCLPHSVRLEPRNGWNYQSVCWYQ
jgi:hypothetical protein